MEIFAGLAVCTLILVALAVVIRTFALWIRTRGLPELLLSLYLSGATVLGYPLTIVSTRVSPAEMWPLHLGAQIAMTAGLTCLLLFTLKVFRPETLWARCLVGLCMLVFAFGGVAYFLELTGENPRPSIELLHINLIYTTPIAFAYFWNTIESLGYARRLRLRVGLGLAEPAVANRMLLWGLMTLAAGTAVVISLVGMLLGNFMSAPMVLLLSGLGIAHASCLFLAFHPPRWYTLWLDQRYAAGSAS